MVPEESSRASMYDVRNYYRDYVKQKNLGKYLLNNANVTKVRKIRCNKLALHEKNLTPCNENTNQLDRYEDLWEVTGIIDKRDRQKASSLSHGKYYLIKKNVVLNSKFKTR